MTVSRASLKAVREYAAAHDIKIVQGLRQEGVTGTKESMDRPASRYRKLTRPPRRSARAGQRAALRRDPAPVETGMVPAAPGAVSGTRPKAKLAFRKRFRDCQKAIARLLCRFPDPYFGTDIPGYGRPNFRAFRFRPEANPLSDQLSTVQRVEELQA